MSGPSGEHWLTDEDRRRIRNRYQRRKKVNPKKDRATRKKRKDSGKGEPVS